MIGSVYRIIHLHSNICYVGSTFDSVRNRWQGHKTAYSAYLRNNKDGVVSIYPYFKQYGIDSFKCILIKEYEVEDKNVLLAYEQLWINKFKSINTNSAFNPLYDNKQYQSYQTKEYYEANKDKILQAKKEYREANKDKIKEKDKQRYKANKDKIKQRQKEYDNINKDKIKQKQKQHRERRKQLKSELEYEV